MKTENTLHTQIDCLKDDADFPYALCSSLAGEVCELMSCNHYQEAGQCLQCITDAYVEARTHRLRLAIENAFLYRLGDFIFCSRERTRLLRMVPKMLREKMIQQVIASGI